MTSASRRGLALIAGITIGYGAAIGLARPTDDEVRAKVEAALGGSLEEASPDALSAAIAQIIAALPAGELQQAIDIVGGIAPAVGPEKALAVSAAAQAAVAQIATANPDTVEDWWAQLVSDSINMVASAPGFEGEPPASTAAGLPENEPGAVALAGALPLRGDVEVSAEAPPSTMPMTLANATAALENSLGTELSTATDAQLAAALEAEIAKLPPAQLDDAILLSQAAFAHAGAETGLAEMSEIAEQAIVNATEAHPEDMPAWRSNAILDAIASVQSESAGRLNTVAAAEPAMAETASAQPAAGGDLFAGDDLALSIGSPAADDPPVDDRPAEAAESEAAESIAAGADIALSGSSEPQSSRQDDMAAMEAGATGTTSEQPDDPVPEGVASDDVVPDDDMIVAETDSAPSETDSTLPADPVELAAGLSAQPAAEADETTSSTAMADSLEASAAPPVAGSSTSLSASFEAGASSQVAALPSSDAMAIAPAAVADALEMSLAPTADPITDTPLVDQAMITGQPALADPRDEALRVPAVPAASAVVFPLAPTPDLLGTFDGIITLVESWLRMPVSEASPLDLARAVQATTLLLPAEEIESAASIAGAVAAVVADPEAVEAITRAAQTAVAVTVARNPDVLAPAEVEEILLAISRATGNLGAVQPAAGPFIGFQPAQETDLGINQDLDPGS